MFQKAHSWCILRGPVRARADAAAPGRRPDDRPGEGGGHREQQRNHGPHPRAPHADAAPCRAPRDALRRACAFRAPLRASRARLAPPPPAAPDAVTVTRADGALSVSWSAVKDATGYNVNITSDGKKSWSRAATRVEGTSTTITGVDNTLTYVAAVQSVNDNGVGGWRDSASAGPYTPPPTITVPDAPASVTVTRGAFGQGTLSVSWPAVSGAASYNVRYSDDGGQTWTGGPSGVAGTSASITGVNDALPYYVAVQASNSAGTSGWTQSSIVSVECPQGHVCITTAPDAVASVSVTRSDGALTASWDAVDGATHYHVTYSADGMQSWSLAASNHASTAITISANNADTYVVGVRAGNDHGWSAWTNSAAAGPYVPPVPDPPAAVASVTVTRADGALTASWDAPTGATAYHVTYSADWGQSWTSAADAHTGTSITISADNAKAYTVGVRAGNSAGWSDWTNSAVAHSYFPAERGIIIRDSGGAAITALAVPEGGEASYQVVLAAAPTETTKVCVYISVRDKNDPDITFKGQAADIVSIDVIFTPDNWNVPQTVTLVAAEDDDYVNGARDSGLDARDYYAGKVDLAVTEIDNDAPPAPASVTVTRSDGALAVSGYAVSGATKYHVTYSSNGGATWTLAAFDHAGTSIDITGADNDATYVVGVRAGADGGWSAWTNSAAIGPLPAAPANLTVTNGDGFFDLAWDAVSGATGYDVRAKISNSASWTNVAAGVTATSYRYTTAAVVNKLAVRTRNAGGASAWTELSRGPNDEWLSTVQQSGASAQSLTMAAAQSGASAQSVQGQSQLAAPASITVTRDNNTRDEKLRVSWAAVSGASGYNLACASRPPSNTPHSSVSWWHCGSVTSGSTTSFIVDEDKVSDLEYNRSYMVAVRAVTSNAADASPWTLSTDVHPAFTPDGRTMSTSRAAGSISLSWDRQIFSQGYEIECATRENNVTSAYTLCADVENQTVVNGKITATISSWTAGGTDYTIDDSKIYDISVRTTNAWGHSPFVFAPLIYPANTQTVSGIGVTTATLTVANYSGSWYYKADKAPDNTCKGPVSGSTKTLTGLTAHTAYVYSAYSDSTCAIAYLIDTVPLTTLSSVSNLGSTKSGDSDIGLQAVAFTTGPNTGGYDLKSVTLPIRNKGGSQGLKVTLRAMQGTGQYSSSSQPSTTILATLSGTAPTSSSWTDTTFTCSGSGCNLDPDTTYFVVAIPNESGFPYAFAYAAAQTETAQPSGNGWSIEFGHYKSSTRDPWKSWSDWNIAEFAFATVPTLASSNVTATGATLTIAGHSGDWWYKHTTPTGGTCSASAVTGTSATLTLTANTAYTFAAYSDASCSTLLATAASFTTPAQVVSVSNLSETTSGAIFSVGGSIGDYAQEFTTGSNSGGYTLSSVTLDISTVLNATGFTLAIHDVQSSGNNVGEPATTARATLTGTAEGGQATFTCSSNCDLAASTSYFVYISAPGANAVLLSGTASNSETLTPSGNGWSIADALRYEQGSWALHNSNSLKIKVTATAKSGGL